MYYQRVWGQIDTQGIIRNIIVCDNYEEANYLTRCSYGEGSFAVEINNWQTNIGDTYKQGIFYNKNGEPCNQLPDVRERMSNVETRTTENEEVLNVLLTEVIPSVFMRV